MSRPPILPAAGLAVGGLLFTVGGSMHPEATGATVTEHLIEMYENPLWTPAHLLALIGLLVSAVSLAVLSRTGALIPGANRLKPFAVVAALGALIATVEFIPHLASNSEAEALHEGHAAPLTDLHGWLGIVSTPALGVSVALLAIMVAVTRTRLRALAWVLAVIATLGGVSYALAGPLIKFTNDPAVSPLFTGAAGIGLWLLVAGSVLTVRCVRASRSVETPERDSVNAAG
jgi:hypothetical protein